MRGYNTIQEFDFVECVAALQESDDAAVRLRLSQIEQADFEACSTKSDYEAFSSRYEKISDIYTSSLLDNVRHKISELQQAELRQKEESFWLSHKNGIPQLYEYLQAYPRGHHASEAKKTIDDLRRQKKRQIRSLWVVSLSLLAVTAFILWMGYDPVSVLQVNNVNINREGGDIEALITTNCEYAGRIEVDESSDWLTCRVDHDWYPEETKIHISATPNEGAARTAVVWVTAPKTLFGNNICEKETHFTVHQASGRATYFRVSKNSLCFSKQGGIDSINIVTDGMNTNITPSESWIKVQKTISDERITCQVAVDVNNSDSRTGHVAIKAGMNERVVRVSQESGLATNLYVSRSSIDVERSGNTYTIDYHTDGTRVTVNTDCSWLSASISTLDSSIRITVPYNNGEMREGNVYVTSNNGHYRNIHISQGGSPTSFYASQSHLTFDRDGDSKTTSIKTNSNMTIEARANINWAHLTVSGTDLTIRCDKNYSSPRDGEVAVTSGNKKITIFLHQKGWGNCRRCGGRGTLGCWNSNATYNASGQHIVMYITNTGWMGAPILATALCGTCGGCGRLDCPDCDDGRIQAY